MRGKRSSILSDELAKSFNGILNPRYSLSGGLRLKNRQLSSAPRPVDLFFVIGGTLLLAALVIFAELSEDLSAHWVAQFDTLVTAVIRAKPSSGLTAFMQLMTDMGSPVFLIMVALVFATTLYRRRLFPEALLLLISLVGGWGWDELLKRLFRRARPSEHWLTGASGYSFPSGHSMVSMALYGVLAYILLSYPLARRWRWPGILFTGAIILMVGISRIYLGVHYPSDVLAGFAAGGAWATICSAAIRKWNSKRAGD